MRTVESKTKPIMNLEISTRTCEEEKDIWPYSMGHEVVKLQTQSRC